jgi:gas vesicle protein
MLIAFLAGAAVGAAVALLTSPKSGPELRASIGEKINDLRQRAGEAVGPKIEKAGASIEALGKKVQGSSQEA